MGDEAGGQQFEILLAITQRRHLQNEGFQTEEQVFAERLAPGLGFQRAIAGGDDAHVHAEFALGTHRADRAFLQHAQELGLQRQRHLADLVEKERTAVGLLEQPLVRAIGAGEGTGDMAEELAFQELGRQPGAVDGQERAAGALALGVHRPGHQFLAGAALTDHQYRPFGTGELADLVEQPAHHPAASEHAVEAIIAEQLLEAPHFVAQAPRLQRAADRQGEVLEVQRLGEELVGAFLERRHRLLNAAERGDHQKGRCRLHALHPPQQRHAIGAGQPQVADHQRRLPAFQGTHRLLGAGQRAHLQPAILQLLDQQLAQAVIVLDQQHTLLHRVSHGFPPRSMAARCEMPHPAAGPGPARYARRTR